MLHRLSISARVVQLLCLYGSAFGFIDNIHRHHIFRPRGASSTTSSSLNYNYKYNYSWGTKLNSCCSTRRLFFGNRKNSGITHVKMTLGFDCSLYPKVAELVYGSATSDQCSSGLFSNSEALQPDIFSDFLLIAILLALNFLSSRQSIPVQDWLDNEDGVYSGPNDRRKNRNNEGGIGAMDDNDDVDGQANKEGLYGFMRRKQQSEWEIENQCPQCRGSKVFVGKQCNLCDGTGIVDLDDSAFYLPPTGRSSIGDSFLEEWDEFEDGRDN